jgi:hypothetical protein
LPPAHKGLIQFLQPIWIMMEIWILYPLLREMIPLPGMRMMAQPIHPGLQQILPPAQLGLIQFLQPIWIMMEIWTLFQVLLVKI